MHGAKPLCAYSQGLVPSFCLLPGAKTLSASLFSVGKITTICAQFLLSLDNRQGKVKRSMDSNLCSQEKQRNCYFLFLDFRGNKIGSSCCTFLEYLKTHILKKKNRWEHWECLLSISLLEMRCTAPHCPALCPYPVILSFSSVNSWSNIEQAISWDWHIFWQ